MKGVGNYREQPVVETRLGRLVRIDGKRAIVAFLDAVAYALPAALFEGKSIPVGARFRLIVTRCEGEVRGVRVEPMPRARPPLGSRPKAKVMVRAGRKLVTRR